MLRGMATVNIWADDLGAAVAWYSEVLGIEPYFERKGPDGQSAYVEFRIGDRQDELGLIDRRYAPAGMPAEPGGAILHWHVDDVTAALERLLSLGAKEHRPVTTWGEGFTTASVVDPFGNVLGIMYNQHFLDMAASA